MSPFSGFGDGGVDRLNGIERFNHYLETMILTSARRLRSLVLRGTSVVRGPCSVLQILKLAKLSAVAWLFSP